MKYFLSFICIAMFMACSQNKNTDVIIEEIIDPIENIWAVSTDDIKGGGKTYELMNDPQFVNVNDISNLNDDDKVALISFKGEVRVYPYYFTNYYEVVNDVFDGKNIAVSYCPLTKSGICFDRDIDNTTYEILASGYLYKDNMVPSDKDLTFLWSQMLMEVIGGDKVGKIIPNYNLIETNWKTVLTYFSDAKVFYHEKTFLDRNNTTSKQAPEDAEYIYGILNQKVEDTIELFQYSKFNTTTTSLINRVYNNQPVIILGNQDKFFVTSYYAKDDLTFSLLDESNFPVILSDDEGNKWNIFGYAVEGPRKGEQLKSPRSYVAQYWAWKDFYSNLNFN